MTTTVFEASSQRTFISNIKIRELFIYMYNYTGTELFYSRINSYIGLTFKK